MPSETLPRPFGNYLLTAALGEDALGRVYRARRKGEESVFARLRLLESPELSNDALLDAIEEGGEVHGFLKNAAIARGVDMDAVDGVPYIAWSEPNGRTLETLIAKCRGLSQRIPVEHALLVAEKMATALDHAYNTTIDGDRTLHGLVWPGFVLISDDGEIRLSGFGLASAVLPAIQKPRLQREIAPYLAFEEKAQAAVARNSDVFSVGAILLELLTGEPPPAEPLAALKSAPAPIAPEIQSVLRMTLGPADSRYKSSGDLRRELGKLLFSGPYSPSTFNLAYFLNDLFRDEIDKETRARARESGIAAAQAPREAPAASAATRTAAAAPERSRPPAAPVIEPPTIRVQASSRSPVALIGALLAAAAVAGIFLIMRRTPAASSATVAPRVATAAATPTLLPELAATPAGPTTRMSEAEFRVEVSRRLTMEVQKLEAQMKERPAPAAAVAAAAPAPAAVAPAAPPPAAAPTPATVEPTAAPTAVVVEAEKAPPTPVPAPTRPVIREGSLVALEEVDTPPRIARIVKPVYPPLALQARIGGIVVLRVLVSEQGAPIQVEVTREGRAGLSDAAVRAVKQWTFTPAAKNGVAVRTWLTVPIPFEP